MSKRILAAAVGFGITIVTVVAALYVARQFKVTRKLAGVAPPEGGGVVAQLRKTAA